VLGDFVRLRAAPANSTQRFFVPRKRALQETTSALDSLHVLRTPVASWRPDTRVQVQRSIASMPPVRANHRAPCADRPAAIIGSHLRFRVDRDCRVHHVQHNQLRILEQRFHVIPFVVGPFSTRFERVTIRRENRAMRSACGS